MSAKSMLISNSVPYLNRLTKSSQVFHTIGFNVERLMLKIFLTIDPPAPSNGAMQFAQRGSLGSSLNIGRPVTNAA